MFKAPESENTLVKSLDTQSFHEAIASKCVLVKFYAPCTRSIGACWMQPRGLCRVWSLQNYDACL